jgi:hypothetical protein
VETATGPLYTEPVELVFNQHPAVFRSALVGPKHLPRTHGAPAAISEADASTVQWQIPVVIVELRPGMASKDQAGREKLLAELRDLGAAHAMTAGIDHFMIHPAFPVDIRHNAKIFREKLAVWAESGGRKTSRV